MKKIPPPVKFIKRDKKGKIKYNTDPKKINLAIVARSTVKLAALKQESKVLSLVKKGHTFEEVGQQLGISPKDALELTKRSIDKWCGELSLSAEQSRELDLKRIDAILVILWNQIEPKPAIDNNGEPVLNAKGEQIMCEPDYVAIKIYSDLLERRARLLGLNPSESSVNIQNNIVLERRYIGGDPDKL